MWSWGTVNSLNIGSETKYVNDHINRVSEGYPVFLHFYNRAGRYLTPSASYNIYTDRIEPFGSSENGVYTSSYRNMGHFRTLTVGGSISYRPKKWGRIYANAYRHVDYFSGRNA